jgi:type III pantothenate kinase
MEARSVSGPSNLLIDVGNTQLKYSWFSAKQPLSEISSTSIELAAFPSLLINKPNVYISSVKSNEVNDQLVAALERLDLTYTFASTQKQQFGIVNSYQTVSNMGCDRWMAIIGADAIVNEDVLVIDAGTAITCDFIAKKQHIGGWIAPGLSMLRNTVVNNTQRVFDFDDVVPTLAPGNDTANCLANGAFAQIIGMIEKAEEIMCSHSEQFSIIVTGGDKKVLTNALNNQNKRIHSHNNLVLAGLARLSR